MPVIATPLPQRLHHDDRLELNRSSWQAADLVGWWPLGNPDGPIIRDLSGYGHHAIATRSDGSGSGAAAWGGYWSAKDGRRAIDFTGSSHAMTSFYAKTPTGIFTPAAATYSFWIRPYDDNSSNQIPFSLTDGINYNLYIATHGTSGRARIYVSWSTYTSAASDDSYMAWGSWMHIAVVRRGVAGAWYDDIYKNGDLYVSHGPTSANPPTGATYKAYFGGYTDGASNYPSNGQWDDFRIYKRSMGAREIKAIYLDTKDGTYGNLARQPTRFYHLPVAAPVVGEASKSMMLLGVE